ncbi:unnamed protein product [Leuciscus chuanchicus]
MKGLVCLLLLLETFVCVVQHQVDGGLNENEISQQLRSEDGRQNPPQTDTLRDEASTDSQQNYHLFFTDIHAALRELTATVTEQKVNIRELTATVTEQKTINRELTATVTEQKVNIRELTATVTEQKANIRELTATVIEQKVNIRELTATVIEQKANIRELTATVTEQKTINRELTATVTEQKVNIRELTATVIEQKANIRELTATVTEQKTINRELTATVTEQKTINRELTANIRALETRLREQQTFILEEMNKKNDEISNLTLSQVELRKENRGRGGPSQTAPTPGDRVPPRGACQGTRRTRGWQFDGPSWAKEDGTLVTALQLVGEGSKGDSHRQVSHWVSTHGEDGAGPGCCPEVGIQRVLGRERTLNNRTTLRSRTGASMGHVETTRRGGHFEQDTPLQQCAVTRTATFNGTCGDHQTKRTLERDTPLRLCTVARTATFNGTCGDHQTKRTLERDTSVQLYAATM